MFRQLLSGALIVVCLLGTSCRIIQGFRQSLLSRDAYVKGDYEKSLVYLDSGVQIVQNLLEDRKRKPEWLQEAIVMQKQGRILINEQLGQYRAAADSATAMLNSEEMKALDTTGCFHIHGKFIKGLNQTRIGELANGRAEFKALHRQVMLYEVNGWKNVDGYGFVRLIFKSSKQPHWWASHGQQLIGLTFFLEGEIDSAMTYTWEGYEYWVNTYREELGLVLEETGVPILSPILTGTRQPKSNIGELTGLAVVGPKLFDQSKGAISTNYFVAAQLCNNLAFGSLRANHLDQAKRYLEQVNYYIQKGAMLKNAPQAGWMRLRGRYNFNQGSLALEENRLEDALSSFRQSARLWNELYRGIHPDLAVAYNEVGQIYLQIGQIDSALSMFDFAVNSMTVSTTEDSLTDSGKVRIVLPESVYSLQNYAQAMADKFEQKQEIQYAKQAVSAYRESAQLIQELSQTYQGLWSKFSIMDKFANYDRGFKLAQELFVQTGDHQYLEDAFSLIKLNKAIILKERVQEFTKVAQTPQDSLLNVRLQRRGRLLEEVYFGELRGYTSEDPEEDQKAFKKKQLSSINRQARLRQEIDQLDNLIFAEHPNYRKFLGTIQNISFDDFQQKIPPQKGVIQYHWGEEDLYMLGMTGTEARLLKANLSLNQIRQYIMDIREILQINAVDHPNPEQIGFLYKQFVTASNRLYLELVAPFWEDWQIQGIEELVFFQNDILSQLPMEVLIKDNPDTLQRDEEGWQLNYLIKDASISYESSHELYQSYPYNGTPTLPYLGIAPPYHGHKPVVGTRSFGVEKGKITALPSTKTEVETVKWILDGDMLIGQFETTVAKFRELASNYQILHFAMHGVLDTNSMVNSGLVFMENPDNPDYYQILSNFDIFSLDLNAELVVLSACETGLGTVMVGEGTISLARAFRAAGCPSTVMTLWKVSTGEPNVSLLSSFFRYLVEGKSKSEALRLAKLTFMEGGKQRGDSNYNPHIWAPFILSGDSGPINILGR